MLDFEQTPITGSVYRLGDDDFFDVRDQETRKWLKKNFPAVMAERPIGMSEDYQFMPSFKIAEGLLEHYDMRLVSVSQQRSRLRHPAGQEHFMKFRLPSALVELKSVGDSVPELVVMNSHNGRSTIRAYGGIFRLICSNGMIVADRSFGGVAMRHFGEKNSFAEFGRTLDVIARNMKVIDARMALMNETMLHPHEQNQLARMLLEARAMPSWVEPADVLRARRSDDERDANGYRSLWLTFNVLQENLTNVAITGRPEGENQRQRTVRPLTGARADVLANEALWARLETFIDERYPALVTEAMRDAPPSAPPSVQAVEEAKVIVEEAPKEEPVLRDEPGRVETPSEDIEDKTMWSVGDYLKKGTYHDLVDLTSDSELMNTLSKEERAKLAKRKSYLKGKEPQVAA